MFFSTAFRLSGLFLLSSTAWTSGTVLPQRRASSSQDLTNAHTAITRMQEFYNTPNQGWWTSGWWNSAECLTLLADLRYTDDSEFLASITDGDDGVFANTLAGQHRDNTGAVTYDNFFDDELWWIVALIKTYDATANETYLNAANASFSMTTATDPSSACGGLNDASAAQLTDNVASSTITTALYVEAAAMLAYRLPDSKAYYLSLALKQWNWISSNLLIDGVIQGDALAGSACTNDHAFLTYIEGTAISGLVALSYASGNKTYLSTAETIANNTMSGEGSLVVNGIVTEYCDADLSCDADESQFKGILTRGLKRLHDANPNAVSGGIPAFLQKNADSIWANNRASDNLLGLRWAGPMANMPDNNTMLAAHSSATMAIVYAAMT